MAVFHDIMENGCNHFRFNVQPLHHPERVKYVRSASLIGLSPMHLGSDANCFSQPCTLRLLQSQFAAPL